MYGFLNSVIGLLCSVVWLTTFAQKLDPCETWCLAIEATCPTKVCPYPYTVDNACKQAACATYKAACLECDIQACAECTQEKADHEAELQAALDAYVSSSSSCLSLPQAQQAQCLRVAAAEHSMRVNNEANHYIIAVLNVATDHTTCTNAALAAYEGVNCCVEQH